jgi:CubicO group peptidase (beta-lactamase class C family)
MNKNRSLLLQLTILLCLLVVFSCSSGPQPKDVVFPGDAWETATPESQGVDPRRLDAALQYLEGQCGEYGIRETVVIRHGRLIWEGPDSRNQHRTWSIGKIFTSTALGLLIGDGKCRLDDRAARYEPLLQDLYGGVTLRHLATMTSGYDGKTGRRWKKPPAPVGDWGPTPYEPGAPLFAPGTAYLYWDEAMMMLGRILTRIAGMDLKDFLTQRVTGPIRMGDWDWETEGELDGTPVRFGGGHVILSARQLARFGYLFLHNGNWNGRQLVDPAWVREATATQVPADLPLYRDVGAVALPFDQDHVEVDGAGIYGYHWWTNGIKSDGSRNLPAAPVSTFYRTGARHNMLFVIPDWDMIIVRLGIDDNPDDRIGAWNTVIGMIGQSLTE